MNLFNFKEFKESRLPNDTNFDDYVNYLDSAKKEIEEAIGTAQEIDLKASISSQLEYSLEFINKLLEIINGSKKTIIMQSIDKLSLQDLQSLYDDKIDEYTNELKELNLQLTDIDQQIEVEINECNQRLSDLKVNYEKEDTEVFFREPDLPFTYIEQLLKANEINEEELQQILVSALQFETNEYKITSSEHSVQCMAEGILTLIKNGRELYKKYPDKLDYIVNSLLADEGIGKVLILYYHENIIDKLCIDMQNISKEKTSFFQGLSTEIQEALRNENFNGSSYKGLYNYRFILLSGNLDVNPIGSVKLDSLQDERMEIQKSISLVEDKIRKEKDFIQNDKKLKNYLKSMIDFEKVNIPSYLEINNYIDRSQEMETIDQQIAENSGYISRLEEILSSTPCYCDEQELSSNVSKMDVDMQSYLDVEEARYAQISIMIEAERKLEELEYQIKSLKNDKFKRALSKSHRQLISEYKRKYDSIIYDTYEKLDDQQILVVEAPDKLNGQFINKRPRCFDDLVYVKQVFWNLADYMEEIISYGLASEEDIRKLSTIQKHCVNKLFNYSKDEDGYYQFSIDDDERNILLQCQESIVYLARALIEKRSEEEIEIITPVTDEGVIEELKNMGFVSFTKDDLQMAIYSLIKENEMLSNKKRIIGERIQNRLLNVLGTMDDALKYRDMLVGFDECNVPIDEIKYSLQVRNK